MAFLAAVIFANGYFKLIFVRKGKTIQAIDKNMDISVVIPVYNGEQTLAAMVKRLQPVLEAQATEYELILVNDGSSD